MGILDGNYDPTAGLLGGNFSSMTPAQFGLALMANSGPTATPHSFFADLGKAGIQAQGLQGEALRNNLYAQEAQKNQLANAYQISRLRYMAQRFPGLLSGTGLDGQGAGAMTGGLLSGNAQAPTVTAQSAPTGAAPATSASPSAGSVDNAMEADFLFPGAGKDIIAKQYPGPTDAQRALTAAGIDPNSPAGQQLLGVAATKAAGISPVIGGERPGVPPAYFNPQTGRYEYDTSQLPAMEAGQFASARGRSQGELGAKEAQDAFKAGLDVKVANTTQQLSTYYQTGVRPPDFFGSPQTPPQVSTSGDIGMQNGSVVPAAPKPTPFMGKDAIDKQNTTTQKTEENFGAIRGTLEGTESRLVALANALKTVQGGGLNEKRADIANNIRGAGLPGLADIVMSGKDTAAVQTAIGVQVLDVLGQLKQINQGSGGRILNSEFVNLLDKQYGPNLSPQANYDLITQTLGGIYQTRNMIDGYYGAAKPAGWRDANAYSSAFYSNPANSYQKNVEMAGKAIGPLKGMDAPPIQGAQKAPDGNWYVADPSRPGKYLMVKP